MESHNVCSSDWFVVSGSLSITQTEKYVQKEGVEMKRICCLKGSPRKKGNTNTLTKIVTDRLRNEGVGIDEFTLYDMDIKGCLACRWCQKDWTQFRNT